MMPYLVSVDDNFHYMDASERYDVGTFATAEEALAKARGIMDDYLRSACKLGMAAEDLYRSYRAFGEGPFIVAIDGAEGVEFSAWDYAKEQCQQLCR